MVARLAPETLFRRLRGWLVIAVIPLGLAIYAFVMFEAAPTRQGVLVKAEILGFGLRERDPTGDSSRVALVIRTADGEHITVDGYASAARCRVGQQISVLRAKTAGGFERWSLPDAPCR